MNYSRSVYRKNNPRCEYCPVLNFPKPRSVRTGLELEHIWGRGPNNEVLSNFAIACPTCHDYKTGVGSVIARIAITYVKMKKGECDWNELQLAAGFDVRGWCEVKSETYPMNDEIKEMAHEIAISA